ncbi:hypothetical protein [Eubacterium xylanophilum]|uniref:hypothetical protein n=1 Tax=Eubacterium xylanophilum TaxID=39497 RepID=UPI0004AD31BF|nr:hypothetical protein [Eubacterium xylanophilum]
MNKEIEPLFLGADTVAALIGCSKSKAYVIIRELSNQLKKENPKALIVSGKINRQYFMETVLKEV